jgi:prevent-host-death family protein
VRGAARAGAAAVLPRLRAADGGAGDADGVDGAVQPARGAEIHERIDVTFCAMPDTIGEHQLRDDTAEIMRRVEAGESFVVTRNGKPIADLVPRLEYRLRRRKTLGEMQEHLRTRPKIDVEKWYAGRDVDDLIFGDDRIR